MPTHVTHRSRRWLLRGLTAGFASGALALTVLGSGVGTSPSELRLALAQEVDCDNDPAAYDTPECVQRREAGAANASQPPAQQAAPEPTAAPQVAPAPSANPADVVLKAEDAGKEAFVVDMSEGSDKYGRWAHSRFERDRTESVSTLGPNVMDTKVWAGKDLETAKALYTEQAAIKTFPERKEGITGPVEKVKPNLYGEESSYVARYYQDDDNKLWHHYRFVQRKGVMVAVIYLFGREPFFVDRKDRNLWNGQGEWFTSKVFDRM